MSKLHLLRVSHYKTITSKTISHHSSQNLEGLGSETKTNTLNTY